MSSSPLAWNEGREREGLTCRKFGLDERGDARGPCLLDVGHTEPHEDRLANVLVVMAARIRRSRERIEEALNDA